MVVSLGAATEIWRRLLAQSPPAQAAATACALWPDENRKAGVPLEQNAQSILALLVAKCSCPGLLANPALHNNLVVSNTTHCNYVNVQPLISCFAYDNSKVLLGILMMRHMSATQQTHAAIS